MKKILLTDEEIEEASRVDMFLPNGELDLDCGYLRGREQVCKAQLKKIKVILEKEYPAITTWQIWQALLEEVK